MTAHIKRKKQGKINGDYISFHLLDPTEKEFERRNFFLNENSFDYSCPVLKIVVNRITLSFSTISQRKKTKNEVMLYKNIIKDKLS